MSLKPYRKTRCPLPVKSLAWFLCALLITAPSATVYPEEQQPAQTADTGQTLRNDELDALVSPIALYPDQILSQLLVASTYPLEIVQAEQWLQQNPKLKGKELAAAAKKQDWDPSIQAMVAFPELLKRMADNIKFTTDLGNAFLAQQSDVMDAIQRMRKKAEVSGKLASNEQQKVVTKTEENKTVVVIQPASPEVVYVPTYNPTVIWGAPVYPYPQYYYPPVPVGGVIAASALSFGAGVAVGAIWGGGWGWGCGWGHNDITINNNFMARNNLNVNNINGNNINSNTWQHNPQHRGGVPYSNSNVANRFGGTARGDSLSARRDNAGQNQFQNAQRGNAGDGRGQDRDADRNVGDRGGDRDRDQGGDRNVGDRSGDSGRDRAGDRGGSNDRIGNRNIQAGGSSSRDRGSIFSGASSVDRAHSSSSRGISSMGSFREGGGFGGGGRFFHGGGGLFRGGGGFRGFGGRRR